MSRILLLDDGGSEVERLKGILEEHGYKVLTTQDIGESVEEESLDDKEVVIARFLEQRLQESKDLFNSMIDSIPALVAYVDKTYCYRYANGYYDVIMDVDAQEDVIGKPIWEVFGEDYYSSIKPRLEAVLSGEPQVFEAELKLSTGEHHLLVHYIPHWVEEEVKGFFVLGYDHTEESRLESELRESENRWRSLVENSPDHIMILDKELYIRYVNFAAPGLTVEKILGTPLYTYVDNGDKPRVKHVLENVLKTKEPAAYETRYDKPDGGVIYYESRVTPRFENDMIVGLTIVSRDITEYKKAEQEIRESERRSRLLLSQLPDVSLLLYDQDLRFLLVEGQRFLEMGMRHEDVEGKTLKEVFPADIVKDFEYRCCEVFKGMTFAFEYDNKICECHSFVNILPVRDESGNIYAGMIVSRKLG